MKLPLAHDVDHGLVNARHGPLCELGSKQCPRALVPARPEAMLPTRAFLANSGLGLKTRFSVRISLSIFLAAGLAAFFRLMVGKKGEGVTEEKGAYIQASVTGNSKARDRAGLGR